MADEAEDADYIGWREVAWILIEQRFGIDRRAFKRTGPDRRKKNVDTKKETE